MSINRTTHNQQSGFTLIEVAVIVPILIGIALVLFDLLYVMVSSSVAEQAQVNLIHDKQTAANLIEDDSALASSYVATNDANLTDPYPTANYTGTWSYKGTGATDRVLLVRAFSTTTNPLLGGVSGRQPVFIGNPSSSACNSTNIFTNEVEKYNVIFFVKNGNLFRRRLVDTVTQHCDPGQYQKLSCPTQAEVTAAGLGTRSASCKADDEILADNVSSFMVNYYDSNTSSTPLDVYAVGADPSLLDEALDIEVTLTLSKRVMGKDLTTTSTLRMTKLNVEPDSV